MSNDTPPASSTTEARPSSSPLPIVPGYTLLSYLSSGGMGDVYTAQKEGSDAIVALKMIRPEYLNKSDAVARFRTEIDAACRLQLQSSHIVKILDISINEGGGGGRPFFTMEFIDGGTLTSRLEGGPMEPGRAARLVEIMARTMHLAHQENIIHRDLKPDNVLMAREDHPKISDFGLAKLLDRKIELTLGGAILGTPQYMAPEQARGDIQVISAKTDVYGLGTILYECLTAVPVFRGANLTQILSMVKEQRPVPPGRYQRGVPPRLEAICLKCLRKEPNHRYKTAEELAKALQAFLRGESVHHAALIAIDRTLEEERERLRNIETQVESMDDPPYTIKSPIIFYGASCLHAYVEALEAVKERFWTTTFLSSGFWTRQEFDVRNANLKMMSRLKTGGREKARRLILLNQEMKNEETTRKQRLIHLRREGNDSEIRRLKREFENLKNHIRSIMEEHCEVRVAQALPETHETHKLLKRALGDSYDSEDSEIAIYDGFRLDVFGGGRMGRITDVSIYSRAYSEFDSCLDGAVYFFDEQWRSATSAQAFLDMVDRAYRAAEIQIDYVSQWLAKYEYDLSHEDKDLKSDELKEVRDTLTRRQRWGKIRRYLDVGTCTGRYLLGLREAVLPRSQSGLIVGLDDDEDCVEFAKRKMKEAHDDHQIEIHQADFTSRNCPEFGGNFDLITCMLGTLSHFGWDKNDKHDDSLQSALKRMSKILSRDGLLIIGNWSGFACQRKRMLEIYSRNERDRLAGWTCGEDELSNRLDQVGLHVVEIVRSNPLLDILFCRSKASTSTDKEK